MKVLTVKTREWFLNDDLSQVHGYGDAFDERFGAMRRIEYGDEVLVVDLRGLSDGEQRGAILSLPVVDTRLPEGHVWIHGHGTIPYDGTHDWLGGAAPDVYAGLAEAMGAQVRQEAIA